MLISILKPSVLPVNPFVSIQCYLKSFSGRNDTRKWNKVTQDNVFFITSLFTPSSHFQTINISFVSLNTDVFFIRIHTRIKLLKCVKLLLNFEILNNIQYHTEVELRMFIFTKLL